MIKENRKGKDRFFQKIYKNEANLKDLASFLLGKDVSDVRISNVEPIIFGNKENDLAFICDDCLYIMMEEQSYDCANIVYRILEYIVVALRTTVESEELLYGSRRIYFPVPKLYVVNVGLVKRQSKIQEVQYDLRLSESYIRTELSDIHRDGADLEVVVHAYDFRMTFEEVLDYIEKCVVPERVREYSNTLMNYALTANSLTYVQRALNDEKKRYSMPKGIKNTVDVIQLLKDRGIFVELLSDKEVCDMTLAQFSRDDILIYQSREEGREEGALKKTISLICRKKSRGDSVQEAARAVEESEEMVSKVYRIIDMQGTDCDKVYNEYVNYEA